MTAPSQFAEIMRRSRLSERDEANGCNLLWAEKDRRALIALVREARALVHETVSRPTQVVWDDWTQRRDAFLIATEEP